MDQPIACTLSAADYRTRRATIGQIANDSLRARERIEAGARFTFSACASTEAALRDLIAAERECCPFLRMELVRDGDALILDVTGADEAQPVIAQLMA